LKQFKALVLSLILVAPSGALAAAFPTALMADSANPARAGELIKNSTYYSSNPSWHPGDDYRMGGAKFPTPVQTPQNDFKSGECDVMLNSIIASECAGYNYCANMNIQSVKPRIIMRLGQIPGRDYSVACAGYIDAAFDKYKAARPDAGVNFSGGLAVQNKPTPSVGPVGVNANNFPTAGGAFPATISDVGYIERMKNAKEGLAEWKEVWKQDDKGRWYCAENCAYATLFVEDYASFVNRKRTEDFCAWCDLVPAGDDGCIKLLDKTNIDSYRAMCPNSKIIQGWTAPVEPVIPGPALPDQPVPDTEPDPAAEAARRADRAMEVLFGQ
jgi:hypothetical protein